MELKPVSLCSGSTASVGNEVRTIIPRMDFFAASFNIGYGK